MRQLSLHVSALSDLEYSAYTEALHDLIAGDQPPSDDYQNVSVGVREVRAWLRGRYASMPLADVDTVCSFSTSRKFPSLSVPSDPQTLLPHFERPGCFRRRAVLRGHAPRYPRERREEHLQDSCVHPRYGYGNRRCAAPRPELVLHPTQLIQGMTTHDRPHGHNRPLNKPLHHHHLRVVITVGVLRT